MMPFLKRHDNGTYYIHWVEGRRSRRKTTKLRDDRGAVIYFANWVLDEWAALPFVPPKSRNARVSAIWESLQPRFDEERRAECRAIAQRQAERRAG